ncbi:hypothetical protein L6Q21_14165 [Sandaracinobacter sp. RS1-74]|uniref:hypothetical protein n=1 Tax=Sandaracinobacteroides sayramensis TaxID=2913411 RepID=UPI001EDA1564|nr:hypothetical protein [Sandaracinobacteroides sayramensis]MCG2842130.1 hypothetical protein [Sandaracinobacteroides sayramensis]
MAEKLLEIALDPHRICITKWPSFIRKESGIVKKLSIILVFNLLLTFQAEARSEFSKQEEYKRINTEIIDYLQSVGYCPLGSCDISIMPPTSLSNFELIDHFQGKEDSPNFLYAQIANARIGEDDLSRICEKNINKYKDILCKISKKNYKYKENSRCATNIVSIIWTIDALGADKVDVSSIPEIEINDSYSEWRQKLFGKFCPGAVDSIQKLLESIPSFQMLYYYMKYTDKKYNRISDKTSSLSEYVFISLSSMNYKNIIKSAEFLSDISNQKSNYYDIGDEK